MDITININKDELIDLYMMVIDRIRECDKHYKTSVFYGDVEGIEHWSNEKMLATQIKQKLDGVI